VDISDVHMDPTFVSKIPPLTEAEFQQLEENILEAGKIFSPIIVWDGNGAIVDGNNRYKIWLKYPSIEVKFKRLKFRDQWEAFDWMYKNQLGRRNLTDEQKTYILGKLYEARKHVHGTNQHTIERSAQNGPTTIGRISEQIAREQGVGKETVKRAGDFAKGIDIIKQYDGDLADKILSGQTDTPKSAVQYVSKTADDQKNTVIKAIRDGTPITGRKDTREAKAIALEFTDDTVTMEFTVDNLIEQMRYNSDGFINSLSNLLMDHKDISNMHSAEIASAIDVIITRRIDQIKERLRNGTHL